jgi:hypothetical protein
LSSIVELGLPSFEVDGVSAKLGLEWILFVVLVPVLASEHGVDAHQELGQVKGFDEVVIATDREAFDAVFGLSFGTQEEHGCAVAFLAQEFAEAESVHVWEHDVEHDQIGLAASPLGESFASVIGAMDFVSFVFQIIGDDIAEVHFVFHQQDACQRCVPFSFL